MRSGLALARNSAQSVVISIFLSTFEWLRDPVAAPGLARRQAPGLPCPPIVSTDGHGVSCAQLSWRGRDLERPVGERKVDPGRRGEHERHDQVRNNGCCQDSKSQHHCLLAGAWLVCGQRAHDILHSGSRNDRATSQASAACGSHSWGAPARRISGRHLAAQAAASSRCIPRGTRSRRGSLSDVRFGSCCST
jgi:hypothetical protein